MKKIYETAKIDVVLLSDVDIITSSGDDTIGTGGDNMSNGGWTPLEW